MQADLPQYRNAQGSRLERVIKGSLSGFKKLLLAELQLGGFESQRTAQNGDSISQAFLVFVPRRKKRSILRPFFDVLEPHWAIAFSCDNLLSPQCLETILQQMFAYVG